MRSFQRSSSLLVIAFSAAAVATTAPSFPMSVINLDRDTARWSSVVEQLTSKGVPPDSIERQPAVHGKLLTAEELRHNATRLATLFATRGMIGCYLSHRRFWERTLARHDAEWCVVLEDDVEVADDFENRVLAAVAELEECAATRDTWDVLLLGALGCVHPAGQHGLNRINAFVSGGGRKAGFVTEHVHVPRRPFGTHAYALSRRGAAKLLRRCSMASMHVDAVAWGLPELNLYCCHPMLAHQAFADSTIGDTKGGIEERMPNFTLDPYTRITFRWVWNEPVIAVPFIGLTLTIGRALSILLLGYIAAAATRSLAFCLGHTALTIAVYCLLRYMVQWPAASAEWKEWAERHERRSPVAVLATA